MDTITHIVLGATLGEALAGKRLGKKAMLLGAVAQNLPDIDIIASCWMDTAHDVEAHRGITHSFLFVLVMAPLLARMARNRWPSVSMSFSRWVIFFGLQLFTHIFLDAFNTYGTGWFEPFSHYRVSFNALFVADPFYTVWLLISSVALLVIKRNSPFRKYWVMAGLTISSFYLYYCLLNKYKVDKWAAEALQREHIPYDRYFTTPAPLNNWVWYIVAADSAGYHTGYLSVFDRNKNEDFHFFPRNDSLLALFRQRSDVQALMRFSSGYYTIGRRNDTLLFNVLRFGQMHGWEDGNAGFVFHYFLQSPENNNVVLQRGRAAEWNRESFLALVRRIKGR